MHLRLAHQQISALHSGSGGSTFDSGFALFGCVRCQKRGCVCAAAGVTSQLCPFNSRSTVPASSPSAPVSTEICFSSSDPFAAPATPAAQSAPGPPSPAAPMPSRSETRASSPPPYRGPAPPPYAASTWPPAPAPSSSADRSGRQSRRSDRSSQCSAPPPSDLRAAISNGIARSFNSATPFTSSTSARRSSSVSFSGSLLVSDASAPAGSSCRPCRRSDEPADAPPAADSAPYATSTLCPVACEKKLTDPYPHLNLVRGQIRRLTRPFQSVDHQAIQLRSPGATG